MTIDQRPGGNTPSSGTPGDAAMATEWPAPFVPSGTPPGPEQDTPPSSDRRVSWYVPIVGSCLMFFAALAVLGALAAGALDSFEFTAKAPSREHQVPVSGAPTLVLRNTAGQIRVTTGAADRVTVRADLEAHGFSRSAARRELEEMDVRPEVSGEAPAQQVTVDAGAGHGWSPFSGGRVDLYVTVPPTTNIRLDASFGDIRIEGVTGTVTIDANAGSTRLENVTLTGASTIRTNAGNVTVAGALAADADLDIRGHAGSINVILPANTRTRLNADADAGDIRIDPWNVQVNREAASVSAVGDLAPSPNSTLTIHADAGNILVAAPSGQRSIPAPLKPGGVPTAPSAPTVPATPTPATR